MKVGPSKIIKINSSEKDEFICGLISLWYHISQSKVEAQYILLMGIIQTLI